MNTQDAKRVLETALICAQAPLPLRELLALFDEQVGPDTVRSLLDELACDWQGRGCELVALASGLALPEPPGDARVSRPAESGEATALFARHDGNAGHHCLPPAGHPRRHRGHPRRRGQHADRQVAGRPRLDRDDRSP